MRDAWLFASQRCFVTVTDAFLVFACVRGLSLVPCGVRSGPVHGAGRGPTLDSPAHSPAAVHGPLFALHSCQLNSRIHKNSRILSFALRLPVACGWDTCRSPDHHSISWCLISMVSGFLRHFRCQFQSVAMLPQPPFGLRLNTGSLSSSPALQQRAVPHRSRCRWRLTCRAYPGDRC